jgi:hypothetical protein
MLGFALGTGTALLLLGFITSPLLLVLIDHGVSVDWSRLSEIGQAYDAASALLSGFAVVGVAVSLLMQVRQMRISQVQAARMMHLELMRTLTADPTLRATSTSAVGVSRSRWRRNIYTNLFFKYLEMGYQIGHISEESLRQHFAAQFQLAHAREFWRRNGDTFRVDADSRATIRFLNIVQEEYSRSLERAQQPPSHGHRATVAFAAGLAAGSAIFRWAVRRHGRGRM